MKKSKYAIDPLEIMQMTDAELKNYIRSASKGMGKKIKAFQAIPYGSASETLSYIANSGSTFLTGASMFATKGLTRAQLQAKAMGVNVVATLGESPEQFKKEADEYITQAIQEYDEEQRELVREMFLNEANFEMLKDYVNVHMDSIYDLLGSDRVNELGFEYEDETQAPEFYVKILEEAMDEFQNVERSERTKYFKEKRKARRKK